MQDCQLQTRRAVLSGLAGAGVASLVSAPALARSPNVLTRGVGRLAARSGVLGPQRTFSLVGVSWTAPARPAIELRARAAGGRWSAWAPASTVGHGPDGAAPATQLTGECIWTGPADEVELRSAQPVAGVRVHFVTARRSPAIEAGGFTLARPVLDAGGGQPPIIARAAWAGARAPPRVPPGYGNVRLAFVHHTENLNGYAPGDVPAMLFAIYQYHYFVRGWHDFGYNFAIDAFGRIWEGRLGGIDRPVVGAQAGGYNRVSTGVGILGSFVSELPSPAAIDALERLLAWKLSLHGVPARGRVTVHVDPATAYYTPFPPGAAVTLGRISGHRDGCSTDCPGDALYAQLPAIRERVAGLAGSPARLTLVAPKGLRAHTPTALRGWLVTVDGRPVAAAALELEQLFPGNRRETLAQLTTAPDGSFTTTVSPVRKTTIRAVHQAAPAAVSNELVVTAQGRH
jgi:hypothetical protein